MAQDDGITKTAAEQFYFLAMEQSYGISELARPGFSYRDKTAKSVELGRSSGTVYDFDQANQAHLLSVFDNDGRTYFKFADLVVQVHVADVKHLGSGEQKGRFYMFNGTSDQFIVTADGNTVNVTRRHDVKYFERPVAAMDAATAVATWR